MSNAACLRLSDFDYQLPRELIAQYPLKERDSARLLVLDRLKRSIEHRAFRDIAEYLGEGDLMVLNDTKVLSSRLIGKRITGGRVEALLLKQKSGLTFEALIKPGRVKIGEKIIFNGSKASGIVSGRNEITFCLKDRESVYNLGVMPLPPYIKRQAEESDNLYYQTVYARQEGAIAAPTAGLHFTEGLIKEMQSRGVETAYITLHVGIGTFKPVKAEEVSSHRMEEEYFRIPESSLNMIEEARKNKSRILAVGTTSSRALETYALTENKDGFTDLFIYPGYNFKLVDCLLTNFHLPKTTLFILACAFAGEKLIKKAYQEAIDLEYRFYSYGDAMLIL